MRLLFFCPDWFPYSAGLAQSCLEICEGLKRQGHEVRIVVAKEEGLESKGMDIVPVPYFFRLLGRNPISFGLWKNIKRHVDWAEKICLFSYMYELNARVVLYRKLGLFNKPLIHFYRGSLEPVPNLSLVTRVAKGVWDLTGGRMMFSWTDKTISNSKPTVDYIRNRYGIKKQLKYIPTAIDLKEYTTSSLDNKRVLFVGRLIENKGVKHFKDILETIPLDWKFTIIGDGPLRSEIEHLKKEFKQIEFLGKVSHRKVKQMLSKSDILVLPTYAEGSPRAVIEASASGVPSISFDVGDVSSLLPREIRCEIGDISRFCTLLKRAIGDISALPVDEIKKRILLQEKSVIERQIEKELLAAK